MKEILSLFLLLVTVATNLHSQVSVSDPISAPRTTSTISVKVKEGWKGKKEIRVDSASVEIHAFGKLVGSGYTDSRGICSVTFISASSVDVKVSKKNYQSSEVTSVKVADGKTSYLNFNLKKSTKKGVKLRPKN